MTRDQHDLLFKTVFENEINTKSIFSMKKTSNVKNFCVKTNFIAVQQHCWIELVFWIILFRSGKWKNQFYDSIFVDNFLKTKSTRKFILPMKKISNNFIKTFHTSQIHFVLPNSVVKSAKTRSNATSQHFDWSVNSLLCSQAVSLQFQQTSNVSSASSINNLSVPQLDNKHKSKIVNTFDDFSIECKTFDISSRMTLQSADCNEFSQSTIVSVHLTVLRSNAAALTSYFRRTVNII